MPAGILSVQSAESFTTDDQGVVRVGWPVSWSAFIVGALAAGEPMSLTYRRPVHVSR